jgi:ABC-type anion transport system duplicated permease subunit
MAQSDDPTFIPAHRRRLGIESFFVRIVATGGIVGIGTALAAILDSQDIAAWIIGLAVSAVVVVLAAVLWSSRTL